MFATVPLRFLSTVIGFSICPVASARRSSAAIALRTVGALTLDVLMTTFAGNAFPGNSCCMRSYVLTTASFCGNVSGPGVAMCICSAGIASATSKPPANDGGEQRPAQDARRRSHPRRHPRGLLRRRRRTSGTCSRSTRSPSFDSSAGRTVSEPSIATRDDDDRRVPEGCECRVARQEQPGHRNHHREPGNEHRAARCCGGNLERGRRAPAGRTLLTLSAQIEQRVVHADREPDQQHDRERFVASGIT